MIKTKLETHYILVTATKGRFKVKFTPDVTAYFTDETLPDKIKYALASRSYRILMDSIFSKTEDQRHYQLTFTEPEITELMKEARLAK